MIWEWLLAGLAFVGAMSLLPALLRRARNSRRKGAAGGVMLGIGLAFMTIFDPGKSESVEEIRRGNEAEGEDEAGAPPV